MSTEIKCWDSYWQTVSSFYFFLATVFGMDQIIQRNLYSWCDLRQLSFKNWLGLCDAHKWKYIKINWRNKKFWNWSYQFNKLRFNSDFFVSFSNCSMLKVGISLLRLTPGKYNLSRIYTNAELAKHKNQIHLAIQSSIKEY